MNSTIQGTLSTVQVSVKTSVQYGATSTEEIPEQTFVQDDIDQIVRIVVPPIILLFGTFGNVMTLLVVRAVKGQSGDSSMSVYFPCLAVCDQIVLTVGLIRKWVNGIFQYDVRLAHVITCKIHKFLVFAVSRMSTWILVAVTSQRAMSVIWPLHQRSTKTKNRARGAVAIIVVTCFLLDMGILSMYSIVEVNDGKRKCVFVKDSPEAAYYQDEVYPWLNIITGSLLPLFLLVTNNIILGCKIRQSARLISHMSNIRQSESRIKQSSSLSITLIVTSVAFIVLTAPIPGVFFLKTFSQTTDGQVEAITDLVNTMLDLLWYCNSAVNFYLYCLTGPTFRQVVKRLLCSGRTCCAGGQTTTATAMETTATNRFS